MRRSKRIRAIQDVRHVALLFCIGKCHGVKNALSLAQSNDPTSSDPCSGAGRPDFQQKDKTLGKFTSMMNANAASELS